MVILESISSIKYAISGIDISATFDYELNTPMVLDEGTGEFNIEEITVKAVVHPELNDGRLKIEFTSLGMDKREFHSYNDVAKPLLHLNGSTVISQTVNYFSDVLNEIFIANGNEILTAFKSNLADLINNWVSEHFYGSKEECKIPKGVVIKDCKYAQIMPTFFESTEEICLCSDLKINPQLSNNAFSLVHGSRIFNEERPVMISEKQPFMPLFD